MDNHHLAWLPERLSLWRLDSRLLSGENRPRMHMSCGCGMEQSWPCTYRICSSGSRKLSSRCSPRSNIFLGSVCVAAITASQYGAGWNYITCFRGRCSGHPHDIDENELGIRVHAVERINKGLGFEIGIKRDDSGGEVIEARVVLASIRYHKRSATDRHQPKQCDLPCSKVV